MIIIDTDMKTAQLKNYLSLLKTKKQSAGFTLIELLVVIGILAVLLAITLIAINPARQFSQANDTKRSSDVNAILNAVGQYSADHKGNLSALGTISTDPATPTAISSAAVGQAFCTALVPTYIAQLPVDPQTGSWTDCTSYDSGYTIVQDTSGTSRITVTATGELTPVISVTR
jgi:type IV pilus assembly protein PilA